MTTSERFMSKAPATAYKHLPGLKVTSRLQALWHWSAARCALALVRTLLVFFCLPSNHSVRTRELHTPDTPCERKRGSIVAAQEQQHLICLSRVTRLQSPYEYALCYCLQVFCCLFTQATRRAEKLPLKGREKNYNLSLLHSCKGLAAVKE